MAGWRNDGEWTADLASVNTQVRDDALRDLRDMLYRGLAKSLSQGRRVDAAFLEDIVQEASLKILEKLPAFEGRSKFRTWAVTIAVRTALSNMRKRAWQDISLDRLQADAQAAFQFAVDAPAAIEQAADRSALLTKLKELIDTELTARQRTALNAELAGMPLPQIAEKLGSNTNSIYKLLHDARKKLRHGLEAAGITVDDVREWWA